MKGCCKIFTEYYNGYYERYFKIFIEYHERYLKNSKKDITNKVITKGNPTILQNIMGYLITNGICKKTQVSIRTSQEILRYHKTLQ